MDYDAGMLVILAYATKSDLRSSLEKRATHDRPWKIIAPFPAKADALRTVWQSRTQTEVVTISRFTQDLFEARWGQNTTESPWRKSRLLLLLNAFKNLHPLYRNVDFGTFKTAYQVYSDLRSYTDAPELPDELLAPFDVSVQELVKLFHFGTQKAGARDEHAAVFDLIAELRASEGLQIPHNPVLVFEGFTFLTPAQISFLEALAIRHEVIVPLPQSVMEKSHVWDWPQSLKLMAEVEVAGKPTAKKAKLVAHHYPAGALGPVLRSWRQPILGTVQVVLGTKTPSDGSLQELPFADIFTKREVDVTAEARDALWANWEKRLVGSNDALSGETLLSWCEEERVTCVAEKNMSAMRRYKVVTMVEDAIRSVEGCLNNQKLNEFLLRLLKEVVSLDAPRNSHIPLLQEKATVRVLGLRDIDSLKSDFPIALCLDGSLGPIKSDHRPYSPEMERQLAKLGPVKRPELDFLFLKAELDELLDRPLTLFIEDGLLKHDLAWKQIFVDRELDSHQWTASSALQSRPNYNFFAAPSVTHTPPSKISATRLQDFLDCPRRYHAKRVEKIIPQVATQLEVDAMAIGEMEHTLVRLSWPKGKSWWGELRNLENEAMLLLKAHEIKHALSPVQVAAVIAEVALYASNGLRMLEQVATALSGIKFDFEVELKAPHRTGAIDCLGQTGDTTVLIDFKRSKGMNPGFNQWTDFEKIQLWFYLEALRLEGKLKDKVVAGYFFFKDMEDSWLASSDTEVGAKLASTMGKSAKDNSAWSENFGIYQKFEQEALERLSKEQTFNPIPLTSKVCNYCELQALCPKSASEREEA